MQNPTTRPLSSAIHPRPGVLIAAATKASSIPLWISCCRVAAFSRTDTRMSNIKGTSSIVADRMIDVFLMVVVIIGSLGRPRFFAFPSNRHHFFALFTEKFDSIQREAYSEPRYRILGEF